ncbi:unnamed protein product [Toxocara canis]|uniref:Putative selenium-binding protein n=1 Tax=Toxocara canis TaxID=6265 RepID=A0A183UEW2_TOXCA|nr:unnamed protein product [Toxocara canis]
MLVRSDVALRIGRYTSVPNWSRVDDARIVRVPVTLSKQQSQVNIAQTVRDPAEAPIVLPEPKIDRERTAIVCCPNVNSERPDKIVVIDVDPERQTYGQVLSFAELPTTGDELSHIGWSRTAAVKEDMKSIHRNYLIAPCVNSSRIYVFLYDNERISVHKCIDEDILLRKDLSSPYGVHSLPGRGTSLFVSTLGDRHGHAKGALVLHERDFVVLDRKTFDVRERLESDDEFAEFGGDFAAQPRFGYMISTEWGHPRLFKHGFIFGDIGSGAYGNKLNVWRIEPRSLKQVVQLDPFDGCMTIAVRFLHNKELNHGFACSAYGSTIFHIHVNSMNGKVCADIAAQMSSVEVEGWMAHRMPAMTADLVISLDDRFMYASAWFHGYVAQYDITDPFRVTLCSKNFLPEQRLINGKTVRGGPSSLQLSLDGKRLYVTTSFYRMWDAQFFPDLLRQVIYSFDFCCASGSYGDWKLCDSSYVITFEGATMFMIDINSREIGGMALNRNFIVDFGTIDGGPYLAHSIRLQGGDCTSESFV